MRHRWWTLLVLVGLLMSTLPAAAEQRLIDPTEEPEITLNDVEARKLVALQNAAVPTIQSEVSPDDRAIFTAVYTQSGVELQFVNILDGSVTPAQDVALALGPLTEITWRDARTIRYLSLDESLSPVIVDIDSVTGAVNTAPFDLLGFPISLAPNASRVLVALVEETSDSSQANGLQLKSVDRQAFELELQSPFNKPVKQTPFAQPWPRLLQDGAADTNATSQIVTLVVQDLTTGEVTPLFELPADSFFTSQPTWTPDGSKLSMARTTIPNYDRDGAPLADLTTQDALGRLAPADNPFLQGNVIDLFDFATGDYREAALRAGDGNGDLFANVGWSTNGQTLMVRMQRPSRLSGRANPVYLFPESSYLRFYDAALNEIGSFDRPEIAAPTLSIAQWISPDEMLLRAPYGLSWGMYYYNRISGEFRPVSFEAGTYFQARATHRPGYFVFVHSSFNKPNDIYRVQWDGQAVAGLTFRNYDLQQINQVQANEVSFTLRNGQQRRGYLVQPAGAAFPPRNAPVVVWQEGGPGLYMTNQWGANVENPYNLLPNFGISVLVVPLPGREGWGPQFYNGLVNDKNFGQIDIDEQAEIVQQMIDRGWTSADSVGITGCSYGGYFTSQSITRYPNLYASANTQCTLLDLFAEWEFGFTAFLSYLEGRAPTTDGAEYIADSPLYNSAKVRTPTLIFHGTQDFLPISLVVNFHDQLDAQGTDVELLQFKDEGHGLSSPISQFVAGQRQIEWFRQTLGVTQAAPVDAAPVGDQ